MIIKITDKDTIFFSKCKTIFHNFEKKFLITPFLYTFINEISKY